MFEQRAFCAQNQKGCYTMKKLLSLTLVLVMIVTCLAGISFAADPIAEVTNGTKVTQVTDVTELADAALITPDGKAVIKFLQDVTTTGRINLPNPCTVDLNGKTITIQKEDGTLAGNGLQFVEQKEATNLTSTVKNGTLNCGVVGVRVSKGAGGVIIDNMIIRTTGGTGLGVYHADKNNTNIIRNTTIFSDIWAGVVFYNEDHQAAGTKVTIENTTIVCPKPAGANAFDKNDLIKDDNITGNAGIVELGFDVKIYGTKDVFALTNATAPIMTGKEAVLKVSDKSASFKLGDLSASGLNVWETEAAPAPVAPVTPAAPATPSTPATPSVPTTGTPDVSLPTTGVSVVALGVMAMVSLAGAVITKKH